MPRRAKRICARCGATCDDRYCPAHARQFLRASGPRRPRVYDQRRWRDYLRKIILTRDPLCKIAILCDGTAPSTEVDHIIPRGDRGGDESMENLQGACHACHSHKTATEDSTFARR